MESLILLLLWTAPLNVGGKVRSLEMGPSPSIDGKSKRVGEKVPKV
jgi:hypothetical protein